MQFHLLIALCFFLFFARDKKINELFIMRNSCLHSRCEMPFFHKKRRRRQNLIDLFCARAQKNKKKIEEFEFEI